LSVSVMPLEIQEFPQPMKIFDFFNDER